MVRSITEDRKTIKKEKRVLFEEKLAIRFFLVKL